MARLPTGLFFCLLVAQTKAIKDSSAHRLLRRADDMPGDRDPDIAGIPCAPAVPYHASGWSMWRVLLRRRGYEGMGYGPSSRELRPGRRPRLRSSGLQRWWCVLRGSFASPGWCGLRGWIGLCRLVMLVNGWLATDCAQLFGAQNAAGLAAANWVRGVLPQTSARARGDALE
jgi:hypothetical protein